jgi:DNA-binding response OmpR family regulator
MSPINVMVVEDEPSIAEVVSLYLRRAGYQVQMVANGKIALKAMEIQLPDILILDIMLPGLDGFEITRWLRDRSDTPIILLTARRSEADRIAGLEMGADDYVVKPFSPQELVSRVRAVLRRARSAATEPIPDPPLTFGSLRIDNTTRLVHVGEQEVILTAKEFEMLWLLAKHPRQVFSREQLLEQVWGHSDYIDPGTVTVHIRRLREKIEADPSQPTHIQTVWGVGYKFEP